MRNCFHDLNAPTRKTGRNLTFDTADIISTVNYERRESAAGMQISQMKPAGGAIYL